jgi:hypothetical protein
MTGLTDPQPGECVADATGQPGGISEVGQQPAPACPTTPRPSTAATIFGRDPVTCVWKMPSVAGWI